MKKYFLSLAMLLLAVAAVPQSKILISKPDVSYSNNILTVKYDITGCGTNQFVDVSLKVINSKGDTIKPSYISGDIGSGVNCGMGKTILWNVVKDNIKIDDDVEVMLSGNEIKPVIPNTIIPPAPGLTRAKVIGSSIFVPGLGQKLASGKGTYLLFSGIVYGAAGASALFYMKHNKYYSDYKKASGADADALFSKSEKSFDTAQYMLYGAAGAWVTNFIWAAVIPIKKKSAARTDVSFLSMPDKGLLISARWTF
jgi:hypothetical protein